MLKAVYLTGLSSFFGALQIVAIYVLCAVSTDVVFSLDKLYLEGFPLFFSVGLLSSILIGYLITGKIKTSPMVNSLILIVSLFVAFCSLLIFSKIFLQKHTLKTEPVIYFRTSSYRCPFT